MVRSGKHAKVGEYLQRSLREQGDRDGNDFEAEFMEALCMRDPCMIKLFLIHQ